MPREMKQVAKALGVERLCETSRDELLNRGSTLWDEIANDRAILRSLHFFDENERVKEAAAILAKMDSKEQLQRFLHLLEESGDSSWELLQNCYPSSHIEEQRIPLILALTKHFLRYHPGGVCRVHGGGFAGCILCILPKHQVHDYCQMLSPYIGDSIEVTQIRQSGAIVMQGGFST